MCSWPVMWVNILATAVNLLLDTINSEMAKGNKVQLTGACRDCQMSDVTLKMGIENDFCPYVKGEYKFGLLTPEGLCSASFAAIWPFANAMRHCSKTGFEDSRGKVTVTCPDGWVQFKLSRTKQDNPTSICVTNNNGIFDIS